MKRTMQWRGTMRRIGKVLATTLLAAPLLLAQDKDSNTPRIEHARLEKRALAGPLAAEVTKWAEQAVQPQWIGYAMAQVASDRQQACCENEYGSRGIAACGTCRLEGGEQGFSLTSEDGAVKLEGPRNIAVLFRAQNKRIVKIRAVSEECSLDAGGLPFVWLTGVNSAESVALLSGYMGGAELENRDGDSVGRGALTAIAMHADSTADGALESSAQPQQPESLRRQTAFWLGEARGKAGLVVLQKMANSDPSADVRAQVAFALSISREPEALDAMIRMAKDDHSAHVRGQALFWLAQKAGQKAVGTITGAIENDPDTEVKKKAVFALSQLPKDEGVPKLVEVAQTNRNLDVRKQAMFWLGQSYDPRALAFFEKVLTQ
jgi:HEAT repeat protein